MIHGAWGLGKRRGGNPYAGLNAFELTIAEGNYDFSFTPYNDRFVGQTKGVKLASGHSSFVVDWGDGTAKETYGASDIAGMHHVYSSAGVYVLTVSDDVVMLMLRECDELTAILGLGTLNTCPTIDWLGVKFGYRFLFGSCQNLKTVDISWSGVEHVDRILYLSQNIESVALPEVATSIGNGIFSTSEYNNLYNLPMTGDIVIPSRVSSISEDGSSVANVFRGIPYVSSIEFPAGLQEIKGNYDFYGCAYDLIFNSPTPPTVESQNVFSNFLGAHIFVPAESVAAYKAAQYWSSFANKIFSLEDR